MPFSLQATPLVWVGRILSALVVLFLLVDGGVDLLAPGMVAAQMAETGFPPTLSPTLGLIVLVCAALYAIPQTAVIGAILVTAFAGGAVATHFRMGELLSAPQLISIVLAAIAWLGLILRNGELRRVVLPGPSRPAAS